MGRKNLKKDLKNETKKYIHDLQQCETMRPFSKSIHTR